MKLLNHENTRNAGSCIAIIFLKHECSSCVVYVNIQSILASIRYSDFYSVDDYDTGEFLSVNKN